ncbi:hypothetical protein EKE94_08695 [Mesobaculum littorinae]|uniref:Uncharacterized protein n=1 Tax=Mesobaculum littorinae TaxID=2486419 RepID=A0A438AJX0_9RHOB|nr:hypothetical protein [Mesobaculum littorinae]RVV98949.1 hypothetical protein EKE94_08695 [Mesobaculum littorinae]
MLPLLAACAATGPTRGPEATPRADARPAEVTLYRDTLTARFDDGQLCAAPRPGRSGGWSGAFIGCAHPWQAVVATPTTRPRQPLRRGGAGVTLTPPEGAGESWGAQPGM